MNSFMMGTLSGAAFYYLIQLDKKLVEIARMAGAASLGTLRRRAKFRTSKGRSALRRLRRIDSLVLWVRKNSDRMRPTWWERSKDVAPINLSPIKIEEEAMSSPSWFQDLGFSVTTWPVGGFVLASSERNEVEELADKALARYLRFFVALTIGNVHR